MTRSVTVKDLGQMALAPELILEIMKHMYADSKICFSLTCRTFFYNYFPLVKKPPRHFWGLLPFLYLLEKDAPNLYVCIGCEKFHSWAGLSLACSYRNPVIHYHYHQRPWNFQSPRRRLGTCLFRHHELGFANRLYLPYLVARGVMNRHLRGEAHGLPRTALEFSRSYQGKHGAMFKEDASARIINDQLFIMTESTTRHRIRNRVWQAFRADTRIRFCRHLSTKQLRLVSPGQKAPHHRSALDHPVGSCSDCLTDYNISCSHEDGEWVIRIRVYQQVLGARDWDDSRDYLTWPWTAHEEFTDDTWRPIEEDEKPEYRGGRRSRPECGLGIVRRTWHTVDGIEPESDGEWKDLSSWAA